MSRPYVTLPQTHIIPLTYTLKHGIIVSTQHAMSSYQQLCELIDTVKAEGHRKVTVTVLPSGVTRKRKSLL